ncbi:copper-binding protein [uncultured Sutterella sp.]|uniref:copper-binding protein n=1 Tax=uncultured Sutterella sp. TaxID=286133 RepID=UPI002628BF65|nr:copper-binding protein [uncultured Sutterella sp.]
MNRMFTLGVLAVLSASVYAAGGSMNGMAGMDHSGHMGMMQGESTQTAQHAVAAKGVVKSVDLKAGKVTISHEPIPELKWPAMTMRFTFRDPKLVEGVKAGDKVNFTFLQEGTLSVLQTLSR